MATTILIIIRWAPHGERQPWFNHDGCDAPFLLFLF